MLRFRYKPAKLGAVEIPGSQNRMNRLFDK